MQRILMVIGILILAAGAASCQYDASDSEILSRCPTLARIYNNGQLGLIRNPIFTSEPEAHKFAEQCRKVASELDAMGELPSSYQDLKQAATLAGEFLTGETYLLASCKVPSVVTLRDSVKIPPPPGFIYVKKYRSMSNMPPLLAEAFKSLTPSEGAEVKGFTVRGRYIVLMEADYNGEMEDNLAHEMVHAYITLACPDELPRWFQEGAAVFFSIGSDSQFYGKKGDKRVKMVTVPENYKRPLYSFQYIEDKVGRQKFYQFVRQSVMTGNIDARSTLGLSPSVKPKPQSAWPVLAIGGGLLVVILVVGTLYYRRETSVY